MTAADRNPDLQAAMVMICAMAIIGVIDNFIPRVAAEIGLWQFHFVRALVALPLVASLSLIGLGTVRPQRWGPVVLRSLAVAVSMLFYFSALALMPIAQAMAGLFTSPIFVLLITALGMGQRIGPWRVVAVAIGFAGILCVLQPDPRAFDIAVLIPVTAGFFYALGAIATRHMCVGESTVALLLGMWVALGLFGAVGLVVLEVMPLPSAPGAAGFVTRGWVWPMWQAAPWVGLQVIGSIAGVFLIIKAYQLGEPSYVAVFEYSVMVFAPLFAWVAFGQTVDLWQVIGIGLIAVAGGIIALRSA
jgi:drug/metabolite transporter (DMT)-like permease